MSRRQNKLSSCGTSYDLRSKAVPYGPEASWGEWIVFFCKKEPPVKAVLTVLTVYQITIRLSGARYIWSVSFTSKVVYHSVKFLGGILARRMAGP